MKGWKDAAIWISVGVLTVLFALMVLGATP